jgi:zinc/manganese transport system substrate-binding protein
MRKTCLYLALFSIILFPAHALAGGRSIVTTILPLHIFTLNVVGDMAEVSLLIPPGSDVHEFTFRPHDMRRLKEADLVLINGAGLDEHISERLGAGDGRAANASEGIRLMHDGRAANPHVWLDPLLAAEQVRNIKDAISRLDPENTAHYNLNALEYISRLKVLNDEIMEEVGSLRGRYLITYHESFAYFARRYGLRSYSLTGAHAEQPLPQRMRHVYDVVRKEGIRAVFAEEPFPKDAMRRLASDLGVRLCTLNSLAAGSERPRYYEQAMRENLKNIVKCLGGV